MSNFWFFFSNFCGFQIFRCSRLLKCGARKFLKSRLNPKNAWAGQMNTSVWVCVVAGYRRLSGTTAGAGTLKGADAGVLAPPTPTQSLTATPTQTLAATPTQTLTATQTLQVTSAPLLAVSDLSGPTTPVGTERSRQGSTLWENAMASVLGTHEKSPFLVGGLRLVDRPKPKPFSEFPFVPSRS